VQINFTLGLDCIEVKDSGTTRTNQIVPPKTFLNSETRVVFYISTISNNIVAATKSESHNLSLISKSKLPFDCIEFANEPYIIYLGNGNDETGQNLFFRRLYGNEVSNLSESDYISISNENKDYIYTDSGIFHFDSLASENEITSYLIFRETKIKDNPNEHQWVTIIVDNDFPTAVKNNERLFKNPQKQSVLQDTFKESKHVSFCSFDGKLYSAYVTGNGKLNIAAFEMEDTQLKLIENSKTWIQNIPDVSNASNPTITVKNIDSEIIICIGYQNSNHSSSIVFSTNENVDNLKDRIWNQINTGEEVFTSPWIFIKSFENTETELSLNLEQAFCRKIDDKIVATDNMFS
jgi:hypothetical protein